jgi:hypothetical protein
MPTSGNKKSVFDPKDLRRLRDICASGDSPFHPKTLERLARAGALPAVKVGNYWCTTDAAVRTFLWRSGNEMLRRLTVLKKENGGPTRNQTPVNEIPLSKRNSMRFTDA